MERRMGVRGRVVAIVGLALIGAPVLLRATIEKSEGLAAPIEGTISARGDTERVQIESTSPTRVSMRNVDFRVGDGVSLRIRQLDGSLRGMSRAVVDFDDRTSYRLTIDTAVVGLTGADLTNLLNNHVFAYRGAPLRKLHVEVQGSELRQSGILHKGVDIPFVIRSTVILTTDQRIRLHPTSIRIFGVNGTKLMNALGLDLQKMLNVRGAVGVSVQGNDMLLSPLVILPPPAIQGHIVQLRVENGELVQVFGRNGAASVGPTVMSPPDSSVRSNYMLYRGGTLHFGKLYMTDAEMFVVDQNPSNPFDFDNVAYQRQLVAGYSRTMPDLGLEVFMPDAGKVSPALTAKR
jgi:hypothetical protein